MGRPLLAATTAVVLGPLAGDVDLDSLAAVIVLGFLGAVVGWWYGAGGSPMARSMFLCPLCLEHGCAVTLMAEFEGDEDPVKAIVADVQGGCQHARRFGALDGQTLMQMWRVIEAALNAGASRPPSSGPAAQGRSERSTSMAKADVLRCAKCRQPIAADEPRIRASAASSYHLACYAKDAPRRKPGPS